MAKQNNKIVSSRDVAVKDSDFNKTYKGLSSGYPYIDSVTTVPNILFPLGTVVEVMGLKASGKTSLVLETLAFYQKYDNSRKILYCDQEGTLKKQAAYAKKIGLNIADKNFEYRVFECLEDMANYQQDIIDNQQYDYAVIVTDTVASLVPKSELGKKLGESKQQGTRAKLMHEHLRKITAKLDTDEGPCMIFINQLHEKIDFNGLPQFGGKQYDSTSSGALKYYCSTRYVLKATQTIKANYYDEMMFTEVETKVGSEIELFAEKNKVGVPHRKVNFTTMHGIGIDIIPTFLEALKNKFENSKDDTAQLPLIMQSKADYSFLIPSKNGEFEYTKPIKGQEKAKQFLRKQSNDYLAWLASFLHRNWTQQFLKVVKPFDLKPDMITEEGTVVFTDEIVENNNSNKINDDDDI